MAQPSGAVGGPSTPAPPIGPTMASYFNAFSPAPSWAELSRWPPDVFALTNLVLDHTEAYRFAVAPPNGHRWPPTAGWERDVRQAADAWRAAAGDPEGGVPDLVFEQWEHLARRREVPLAAIRRGDEATIWESLLTLHAMADEACRRLATTGRQGPPGPFERRAWRLLAHRGSLSRIDPARVRITPKTHFASRGITIRSLSRYLALNYESIEVHWRRVPPIPSEEEGPHDYSILLVPWPLEVRARAFRPVKGPLENMDPAAFGFFEFRPDPLDLDHLARLVDAARRLSPRIDAVVLPEAAVEADRLGTIEKLLGARGVLSLIAGVRAAPSGNRLGQNYVHLGICTGRGWQRYVQAKHHRWCLDGPQIRQYHLRGALDEARSWWEAIELPPRTVEILDLGNGQTSAPLVCEDLARMDEVADLLRRIGPTLVIALLLDGPQLPQRWPGRYATVLADEPGSAVLTLTSLGMALRSIPPGATRSRAVAMWNDPSSGLRQIDLGRGASGILLTASSRLKTVWTADGRRHDEGTPSITLNGIHQLRIRRPRARGGHRAEEGLAR